MSAICFGSVFALAACSITDSTLSSRYESIDLQAEKARNKGILLNIVRASNSAPLNFVKFSKISGSNKNTASLGLPTFYVGPDKLTSQRQFSFGHNVLSGSMEANSNFDIGIQEDEKFYTALLMPVNEETLNFFLRQGY